MLCVKHPVLISFSVFLMLLLAGCAHKADDNAMTQGYVQISQEDAKEMMERDDGHVIVDVRRQDEYDAGHIPGAILIPNESIGTEQPTELPDLDQIILIYCRSGNRSKQAAEKLSSMGYTNIYEFGGINTWSGDIVTDADENMEEDEETEIKEGETVAYPVPDITLNSGYTMPVIGLGTWTLSNEEAENSVYAALKCGMRLIDTARYYHCEEGVGRGLQRAIDEGIVTREDVFITSKIMPSDYTRAAQGIADSLSDLGVEYVDLMLIHQPGSNDEAVYQAMEQAVRDRKVRSIGISNYYTREQLDEVLSYAEIVPDIIQNENHLYYQNTDLQEYAAQFGIHMESWYPFGGRGHTQEHFGNETIMAIADAHGKTPAQVILRWHIQAGYVAIPGSSNPEHIAENYDIFDFELTDDEMRSIEALDRQERYENW